MHIPVLLKEVIYYLNLKPNENFIDATLGDGGHGLAIVEAIQPNGRLLGIDWDGESLRRLKFKIQNAKFKNNLILVNDNFVNVREIVERENFKNVSGILFDLGLSSWHLEKSGRGFTFQKDEPLDMRYNLSSKGLAVADLLRECQEKEIEKILREYGEEKFSGRIAKEIVKAREQNPLKTTFQLVEIIKKAVPKRYHIGRINPATRTFQALRIAVNDELVNVEKGLSVGLKVLEKGGRMVVISFHSGEDRIVKNFFKNKAKEKIVAVLTKKPIRPSIAELRENQRSRSAKLRAVVKL